MCSEPQFMLDNDGYLTNQKCFILTGNPLSFLVGFFNSKLFKFCFWNNFPTLGEKGRELSKIFFDKIPVIEVDSETNAKFEAKIMEIQNLKQQNADTKPQEIEIDSMIFDLYQLTVEERNIIGFIEIQ
jgi:hypothetical protein